MMTSQAWVFLISAGVLAGLGWLASWQKRLAFLAARVAPSKLAVGLSSDSWYTPVDEWLRARVTAAAAVATELHVWVDETPAAWVPELARFLT